MQTSAICISGGPPEWSKTCGMVARGVGSGPLKGHNVERPFVPRSLSELVCQARWAIRLWLLVGSMGEGTIGLFLSHSPHERHRYQYRSQVDIKHQTHPSGIILRPSYDTMTDDRNNLGR